MAKKILPIFFMFTFFFSTSYSQDFLGLTTGNFSGITGVSLQPASIVDSRHKFDINLFSTGVNYGNNYFLLDRDLLLKFNKNKFDDYATFKDRYLSEATLMPGEKAYFNINNRTQIPLSFMATTGKKSAIALNMQLRTIIQGRGISQDFAKLAYNDFYLGPLNNTTIDASGISINSLSWAEVGFTYGRVLISSGEHFLKGAITGKYLAGLSSVNISSNDLRMSVNSDSTFNFNTSNVTYNHNENADFDKLFDKKFSPDASAFGLDAGLVYEYRGNIDKFKYLKTDDEKSYDALRRDVNKYIFKLGVSLVDVGMFNFNKPANVNSFQGNISNWDIRNANYKTLKDFDTALANRVLPNLNDPRNYNVYLPTALSAQFDVKFVKGLFLNVMSYWPVSLGDEPGKRFDKFGYYTITPRFETRHFGLYIPYTVTQRNDLADYKQHLLGATVRLGPLFIGSSNLGSMLFNKELKSADVHVGLKVGFTYGKPNKSTRILSTVFKEEQTAEASGVDEMEESRKVKPDLEKEKKVTAKKVSKEQGENSLILDYKAGKVYDNPEVKQNITIINNYYYGSAPAERLRDTIAIQRGFPVYDAESLQVEMKKIADQRNKVIADSIKKVTADSLKIKRQQLDSLIKSMQQLQKQMDSTSKADIEDAADSDISNNLKMERLQRDVDTLMFRQDSLQARRGEAIMSRTNTYRQDSVRADLERQNEQALTDKKKVKSITDSVTAESNTRNIESRVSELTDSLSLQREQDTRRQQQLVRLQDSISKLSLHYADLSESVTKARESSRVTDTSSKALAARSVGQKDQDLRREQQLIRLQDSVGELSLQYADLSETLIKGRENSQVTDTSSKKVAARSVEQKDQDLQRQQQLVRLQDSVSKLSLQYADLSESLTKARESSRVIDTSSKAVVARSVEQKDRDLKNQQNVENLQDSLSKLARKYSVLTDSLSKANIAAQRNTRESVLFPAERNAIATSRIPERSERDSKEYQRLQDQQNDLYRQYARQADALSKDIDRLNSRLVEERRDNRRNPSFIPVPVPVNNSRDRRQQDILPVSVPVIRDTVKVIDTVYMRDSLIVGDIIRITDSLQNLAADSFVSRPVPEKPRIDTVLVRDTISQPGFNFASLPEENVLFDLGKSSVQPIYESKLNYIADILLKNPGLQVRITGHTDSSGSRTINEKLSLERAKAVSNYLTRKGVSQSQIVVNSEVFENPAVSGNTKSARSQNRRVALNLEKM